MCDLSQCHFDKSTAHSFIYTSYHFKTVGFFHFVGENRNIILINRRDLSQPLKLSPNIICAIVYNWFENYSTLFAITLLIKYSKYINNQTSSELLQYTDTEYLKKWMETISLVEQLATMIGKIEVVYRCKSQCILTADK